MWRVVESGGWLMVPIVLCSALALAIVLERLWALSQRRVMPPGLVERVATWFETGQPRARELEALRSNSALGFILAAGLEHVGEGREAVRERLEDAGRQTVQELERYLNTLGTIAVISPLLGLLGTVLGMIRVFAVLTSQGSADPASLAGGISEALITTAAGLVVAIPALIAYRYLRGRIESLALSMEGEASALVRRLSAVQAMPQ